MRRTVRLALALLLAFPLTDAGAEEAPAPGILSHSATVSIRPPRRVTPLPRVLLHRGEAAGKEEEGKEEGDAAFLPARVWTLPDEGRGPSGPPTALSSPEEGAAPLDVYALSPSARFLALPRGTPPAYAAPPPAVLQPRWQTIIDEAHALFGLDKSLIASVIRVESRFQAGAQSPKGAQGAMQLMPGTQVELGLIDPFDPRANVYAGTQYLKEQLDRFGRLDLALAAYNAGPGNVEKYGGVPPFAETQDFVRRVMAGL